MPYFIEDVITRELRLTLFCDVSLHCIIAFNFNLIMRLKMSEEFREKCDTVLHIDINP